MINHGGFETEGYICEKCGLKIEQKYFTDLYRIEGHHLHPSFMDNPKGLGEIIYLCHDCHIKELHPSIFIIIKKYSNLLSNKNKSWHWVWNYHVLPINRSACIEEVKKFTLNWIKKEEHKESDTQKTSD